MVKRRDQMSETIKESIRGGVGRARAVEYLAAGEMEGIAAASLLTLEPGTTIGDHLHDGTEELYLILSGEGTGSLDGERFPVRPGDLWVVRTGHRHGIENGPDRPLEFLAVLTVVGRGSSRPS